MPTESKIPEVLSMKAISWNFRGLGNTVKWAVIKEVIHTVRANLLLLQETKLSSMSQSIIRDLWGNRQCLWVSLDAVGTSGGILLCRKSSLYVMKDHFIGAFSASAMLEDRANGSSEIISSMYGPTNRRLRGSFWCELDSIRSRWVGPGCIGDDWNITRFPSDKSGAGRISADTESFSNWINSHYLVDLQLGGGGNHQSPPTLSRLDRFLVTGDWINLYPEVFQIAHY